VACNLDAHAITVGGDKMIAGAALRFARYAIVATTLFGCSTPTSTTSTFEKASRLNRETQSKAYDQLAKFFRCTNDYSQKNWAHLATATEIADSAVVSCQTFLDGYEILIGAAYHAELAMEMSYSGMSIAASNARSEQILPRAKADADRNAQQAKAISIKFVIEARAKAEKALRDGPKQDKEQSPAPQPPAKGV